MIKLTAFQAGGSADPRTSEQVNRIGKKIFRFTCHFFKSNTEDLACQPLSEIAKP
jgi:hypothetical protein